MDKKTIFATVSVFASLILSAFTAEVILRLMGHHGSPQTRLENVYHVDDPVVDWRYVPFSSYKEGTVTYRYNGSGFRDVEHVVEKPLGVKRILVVGDSVSEGYGVRWEATFSNKIQAQLGDRYEVITIAQGGLNTPQGVHLLAREGLRYKPDLVVLNFILNDSDFYSSIKASERYYAEKDSRIGLFNVPVDARLKRLLKSSALIYFAKERAEDLKGKILGKERTDYYSSLWEQDANRRKVSDGLDMLAGLQKANDFEVVIIVWPLLIDYANYQFTSIHLWVHEQAESRGFAFLDLLPSFSRISYRDLQVSSEDNIHPNGLGHKVAATSFLTWYVSRYGTKARPFDQASG